MSMSAGRRVGWPWLTNPMTPAYVLFDRLDPVEQVTRDCHHFQGAPAGPDGDIAPSEGMNRLSNARPRVSVNTKDPTTRIFEHHGERGQGEAQLVAE